MSKLDFTTLSGGLEPVVDSADALDAACDLLARLDEHEAKAAADRDAKVQRAGQAYVNRLTVLASDVGEEADAGLSIDLRDYRNAVATAAADYVRNHRDEVFAGNAKTAKRPTADISLRAIAAKVGLKAGTTKDDVVKRITEPADLIGHLDKLLAKLGLARKVRIKVELDLKAIQEDDKAGRLEGLSDGLKRIPAGESVAIKPATRPVA